MEIDFSKRRKRIKILSFIVIIIVLGMFILELLSVVLKFDLDLKTLDEYLIYNIGFAIFLLFFILMYLIARNSRIRYYKKKNKIVKTNLFGKQKIYNIEFDKCYAKIHYINKWCVETATIYYENEILFTIKMGKKNLKEDLRRFGIKNFI